MILPDHPATDPDHPAVAVAAQQLGEHLRGIRVQQNLSLQDVQDRSGGEFKTSALGAYERGNRGVSVPRLLRLAAFYKVPVSHLLPQPDQEPDPTPGHLGRVRVNLQALARRQEPEVRALRRYVRHLQLQRGDFNLTVLTIRAEDVHALAAALDRTPRALVNRLRHLGVCHTTS